MSAPSGGAPSALGTRAGAPDPARVAGIVATIAALVTEVIGEDAELDLDITADSSFSEDIEIESIEFVALAEHLQETYGERIDLIAWLGDLDLDEIIDLSVGELATFVAACLEEGEGGA